MGDGGNGEEQNKNMFLTVPFMLVGSPCLYERRNTHRIGPGRNKRDLI